MEPFSLEELFTTTSGKSEALHDEEVDADDEKDAVAFS